MLLNWSVYTCDSQVSAAARPLSTQALRALALPRLPVLVLPPSHHNNNELHHLGSPTMPSLPDSTRSFVTTKDSSGSSAGERDGEVPQAYIHVVSFNYQFRVWALLFCQH